MGQARPKLLPGLLSSLKPHSRLSLLSFPLPYRSCRRRTHYSHCGVAKGAQPPGRSNTVLSFLLIVLADLETQISSSHFRLSLLADSLNALEFFPTPSNLAGLPAGLPRLLPLVRLTPESVQAYGTAALQAKDVPLLVSTLFSA